jgi:hypothetical protein
VQFANSDSTNPGRGRKLDTEGSVYNEDTGAVEIAARATTGGYSLDTCFGLALEFFDGDGNALGTRDIHDPTDICMQATGGYVFHTFHVPSNFLPTEGGFICLLGYDFTRLLAYGTTYSIAVPCSQYIGLTTEDVADDTKKIPGPNESYQRTGFGFNPEDFTWNVQGPTTFDSVNEGQVFPICLPDEEFCCEADADCDFWDDGCLRGVCFENQCVKELNCVYGHYNRATQTCDCVNGGVEPSYDPGYCYDANGACTIYKEHNPTTNMFECGAPGGAWWGYEQLYLRLLGWFGLRLRQR